ncbi:GTP-binding nuclear protein Ran-like isoform X1 [Drosophila miranda]|uniref:GTP-binding nuclear protein Ran-like isoform X1 n=1 Tax=Drosophila miranda TaxID=7229 RepID=UPI0007E725CA|nr:GTP-binding nuclear protein Ran-like isoform X1 [Drosophila miranda]
MDVPTYKCIIMGEKHCGKTTFLRRHLTGEFMSEYVPTDRYSVNIDTLIFSTNRGPIRFDVWDWGKEDEELGCYPDDFYSNSHCAILMLDVSSVDFFQNFDKLMTMNRFCPGIPVSICGNKWDIKPGPDFQLNPEHRLCEISVKTGLNMDGPFLNLARKLFNDFTLEFVQLPPLGLPLPGCVT